MQKCDENTKIQVWHKQIKYCFLVPNTRRTSPVILRPICPPPRATSFPQSQAFLDVDGSYLGWEGGGRGGGGEGEKRGERKGNKREEAKGGKQGGKGSKSYCKQCTRYSGIFLSSGKKHSIFWLPAGGGGRQGGVLP